MLEYAIGCYSRAANGGGEDSWDSGVWNTVTRLAKDNSVQLILQQLTQGMYVYTLIKAPHTYIL